MKLVSKLLSIFFILGLISVCLPQKVLAELNDKLKPSVQSIQQKANQGEADAQFALGRLYYQGAGFPQDTKQAIYWLTKAAKQGHVFAQYKLGDLYMRADGEKFSHPHKQAVFWYTKAAEQGFVLAQYELGRIYKNGNEGPPDYRQALFWFTTAAENGQPDAKNERDKVLKIFLANCDVNIDEGCSVNISHPTGISLVGTHTDRVQISWNSVSEADGYKVYRATSSNGTYSMLTTGGGTSYSDYDVTSGTTYYYKVSAYNGDIESDYSSIITGHIITLSVPTGVSASNGTYSDKIKINWDLVLSSSGYKVYRATSLGGPYDTLAIIEENSYNDYAVTPGATYYYKVTAYNGPSESAYSNYDAGYAGALLTLSAPTEVKATLSKYADRIRITWNSVYGASGYKLYRSTKESGGTYSEISSVSGTSYDDYSVTPYTRYYYKVIAYNSLTESLFSSSDFGLLLSVPTGVNASNGTYSNSIKITWDLVSFSSGYKIYRATSLGGPYSLIYTSNLTTFYDQAVTPGATYYYKVTAYNEPSESAHSIYAAGYAGTLITSAPTGLGTTDGTGNGGCTAMTSFATIVSTHKRATTKFDTVSIDYSVSYSISNAQANSDGYTAKIEGLLEIYDFNDYTWADVAAFDEDITNSNGTLTGSLSSNPYDEALLAEKMRLHIQYACIGQISASEAFSNELEILH